MELAEEGVGKDDCGVELTGEVMKMGGLSPCSSKSRGKDMGARKKRLDGYSKANRQRRTWSKRLRDIIVQSFDDGSKTFRSTSL